MAILRGNEDKSDKPWFLPGCNCWENHHLPPTPLWGCTFHSRASIGFDLGFRLHFVLCTNLQVHGVLLTNILGHQGVNLTPGHRWKRPSSFHFKRCRSLQVNSKQHVLCFAVLGSLFQDCAAGRSWSCDLCKPQGQGLTNLPRSCYEAKRCTIWDFGLLDIYCSTCCRWCRSKEASWNNSKQKLH